MEVVEHKVLVVEEEEEVVEHKVLVVEDGALELLVYEQISSVASGNIF